MPPQKTNAKAKGASKAPQPKQGKAAKKALSDDDAEEEEDEDDDEDDDDIDEDDVDEDVSLGSVDEDEDLDDEEGSEDADEDDDMDDDDAEEELAQKPAKKAKLNGKEEPAKPAKTKQEAKKAKQEAEAESKAAAAAKEKEKFEDRASAVGPLTEEERKMFAANFRAMSATSVFVGKLPSDTTDEDLKKLHPSIRSIRRPVSRKGLPATFGFLNFANKETAERALKEIKKKGVVKIRGQEVLVSENGNGQCHPPTTVDRRKLRIYGCPKFVTKESIKKSLPGCVDVLLGDKDKGNAIEAVAVFRSSADTKKVLLSQQTLTLNECVCALFYLNISHNVKQHERKKDRKQAMKQKALAEGKTKAASESDEHDDSGDLPADKIVNFKKENVKPQVQSAKKSKKRPAPDDDDDDDDAGDNDDGDDDDDDDGDDNVVAAPTPKSKKVSMKSPQKTPAAAAKATKKTPMRKGTPFKKAKTAG